MYFLFSLFLISSLLFSPIKSNYQLPTDFVKATIPYIQQNKSSCTCTSQIKCKNCLQTICIEKEFYEALYYFAFTVEPETITHLLQIINDLKKSIYIKKERLNRVEIKNILQFSPSEYEEHFYPKPPAIKLSPSQKQREKTLRLSSEQEDPLRNARNYYHLLLALQEGIAFLLLPKARMLLEKNFVMNGTFNFNQFIQYFGHKKSPLHKKLIDFKKGDSYLYFEKNKYGKHHFYEVKARTLRLFKKILELYLKEMSLSRFYQNADEHTLLFSEKKKSIQNSLKKAHFLLTSILPHDQLLLEKINAMSPRFHRDTRYNELLDDEQ